MFVEAVMKLEGRRRTRWKVGRPSELSSLRRLVVEPTRHTALLLSGLNLHHRSRGDGSELDQALSECLLVTRHSTAQTLRCCRGGGSFRSTAVLKNSTSSASPCLDGQPCARPAVPHEWAMSQPYDLPQRA